MKIFIKIMKYFIIFLRKKVIPQFTCYPLWNNYIWIKSRHENSKERLKELKNIHKGESIYVIASGPSLAETDLSLLNDKAVVSIQYSYKAVQKISNCSHYWLISDKQRINDLCTVDRSGFVATIVTPGALSFSYTRDQLVKDALFITPKIRLHGLVPKTVIENGGFEFDLSKSIARAGTKSIFQAIQIAVYLGAAKVVLLGADFGDIVPTKHHFEESVPVPEKRAAGHDPYEAQYPLKIRPALERYYKLLKEKDIELVNASPSTREDVLPHVKLEEIVKEKR